MKKNHIFMVIVVILTFLNNISFFCRVYTLHSLCMVCAYPYRVCRDDGNVWLMDNGVAVYLPRPLIEKVDAVARDELRSRTNTVRWLVTEALERREPADEVESR